MTHASSRFTTRGISLLCGFLFLLLSLSAQACEKITVSTAFEATLKDFRVDSVDLPCNEALYYLMHNRAQSQEDLNAIATLIRAGNIPSRAKNGDSQWWEASASFLNHSTPLFRSDPAPPMQQESYALYADLVLPKLEHEPIKDSDYDWIVMLTRTAVLLPDPAALKTLNLIGQRLGTERQTRWEKFVGDDGLRTAQDFKASPIVIDWILKRSDPTNTAEALMLAIDHDNPSGVRKLLDSGASPIAKYAIRHALTYKSSEASQILLAAVPPYLKLHHETLAPADADDLLLYIAQICRRNQPEASDIDFVVALGADPTRAFQNPNIGIERSLPARAIECPDYIPPLVKHGLNLDLAYPPLGQPPLIASMRLKSDLKWDKPRALEVMLRAHNNVNMRDPSSDIGLRPLTYAILLGDPEMVTTLLNFGADPQALDRTKVPAWYAVFDEDRLDLLTLILKARPRLSLQKLPGLAVSPLGMAKCGNATKIAAFLEQRGAKETGTALCEAARKNLPTQQ